MASQTETSFATSSAAQERNVRLRRRAASPRGRSASGRAAPLGRRGSSTATARQSSVVSPSTGVGRTRSRALRPSSGRPMSTCEWPRPWTRTSNSARAVTGRPANVARRVIR
ncbi:MAG: hypothetical protein EDX89_03200 [Acidobacteria bacterium]|nr:MAG: hypothetical protein EDX89_03200 [Acidobacteriota bacterium]